MLRSCIAGCLAGAIGLVGVTQAAGQPVCRPVLGFKQVRFSSMQPPTMARTWTAVMSVDASGCAANSSGHFHIVLSQLKENAPDSEFRERFVWQAPAVEVAVDFSADEAVAGYRVDTVAPCPCGR
jgi:hypothetical protein